MNMHLIQAAADSHIDPPASLLPVPDAKENYGMFGYRGNMCERAIRSDNAAMLRECIDRGFIDRDSEMLDGKTILQYCAALVKVKKYVELQTLTVEQPRAAKCADMLRGLGWRVPAHKASAFGIS